MILFAWERKERISASAIKIGFLSSVFSAGSRAI